MARWRSRWATHTVRLMPASDLSGRHDGPTGRCPSRPIDLLSRRRAGRTRPLAGGTSGVARVRVIGRGSWLRWTAASLKQIHRRSIATVIDFSVSDGGCGGRDGEKMELGRTNGRGAYSCGWMDNHCANDGLMGH